MLQKMIADHAGHYTRPDVFTFAVNRQPKRIATFDGAEALAETVQAVDGGITNGSIRTPDELADALRGVVPPAAATGVF